MTMQEAKQYLRQVKRADDMVKSKIEQLFELRQLVFDVSGVENKERVQATPNFDKTVDTVAKIIDLERELDNDIDRLIDLKFRVSKNIDKIDNYDYRLLLMLRYLNFKTWGEIAEAMGFSDRHTRRLHGCALYEFAKI